LTQAHLILKLRISRNINMFSATISKLNLTLMPRREKRREKHHHHINTGDAGFHHGPHQHRWGQQPQPGEMYLSDCKAGDTICVRRILNGGPIRHRLLEMGLNPGTRIRVVKYAPLKDPIECELKGYHIALRVAEARHVIVSPEEN
jgi:Fe2+ transport system protein FeoA